MGQSHHDIALNGGDNAWATTTTFAPGDFLMNNFMDTATEHVKYDPNGTRTLGYYNQNDLPYYYDLATFFATSDAWHSPILANTVPNRMYLMAATSFGHQYPDSRLEPSEIFGAHHLPGDEHGQRKLDLLLQGWDLRAEFRRLRGSATLGPKPILSAI